MEYKIFTNKVDEELKVLNTVSEPINDILVVQDLAASLKNFLNNNDAVGISAPQFGINKMIFAMINPKDEKPNPFICINPQLEKVYENKVAIYTEGCLSVPDSKVPVRRYKMIKVSYYDENGKRHKRVLRDFEAVIFQHELDHMYGVLMTSRSLTNESEEV